MKSNWPSKKLGEVCILATGGTPSKNHPEYFGGDIKWLVSGDVNKREIYDCEGRISELGLKNSNARILPKNSVLIALNGQGKTRGIVAILRTEATCNQSLVAIIPNVTLLSAYLYYNLDWRYQEIRNLTGATDRRGLSMKIIKEIKITIPGVDEQKRIVEKLEKIIEPQKLTDEQFAKTEELFNSTCLTFFNKIGTDFKKIKLGEVCNIVKGKSPILKAPSGEHPLVVTAEARKTSNEFQFDTAAVCVPLISSSGHGHADIKRIHYQEGKFALANIMAALIPDDSLLAKFLFYYLSFYKDELFIPLMAGSANVTIPLDSLKGIQIPMPPIKIQQEVIEKLLKIEELKKALVERKKLLQDLFNSSLNMAFQGKLT